MHWALDVTTTVHMLALEAVQSQLDSLGIDRFTVVVCEPEPTDIRTFFRRRSRQLQHRRDAPIHQTFRFALPRLEALRPDETIYRWEAESSGLKIVGYSTRDQFVAVYPWIMRDGEWVGSVARY